MYKKVKYCFLLLIFTLSLKGQPDIGANVQEGCDSLTVTFSLLNIDPDSVLSVIWIFGNGNMSNLKNPLPVKYYSPYRTETFTVTAYVNAKDTIIKEDFITIYHSVRADFECFDTLISEGSIDLVCMTNDREYDPSAIYSFDWQFEDYGTSGDERPLISYPEPDTVSASLTVRDETHGCEDSYTRQLLVASELRIPNVFTPNGDEHNQSFKIKGLTPMQIKIYNRYGILVYQAEGSELIWDGTTATGTSVETGVYFYILKSLSADPTGKYNKTGFVHLFR